MVAPSCRIPVSRWGTRSIPTTFLIDREGRIIHQKSGMWKHEEYEALVKKAL